MSAPTFNWEDLLEDCKICVLRACTPFSRLFFFLTSNSSNRLRLAPALASLPRAYFNPALVRHACEEGHVSIVEWLIQHHIPIASWETDAAVIGGHLPLVKLLLNSTETSFVQHASNVERLASMAAGRGHWDVVNFLFEARGPFRAENFFDAALRDNQATWIERALAPNHASSVLTKAAAKAGDVALLQRIYSFPTFELTCSKAAFIGAVEGAQLAALEWLLSETSVGKLKPHELAALLGYEQWYPLCAKTGALLVLRFLRDRKVSLPVELPRYCAAFGNVEALQWLLSRPIRGRKPLAPIVDEILHEAAHFGHQPILDLLEVENHRPLDLERVLDSAAEGGQVALLRTALAKLPQEPDGELAAGLLSMALNEERKDANAFAFLLERFSTIAKPHGKSVIESAARNPSSTPLRLLHSHGWNLLSVPGLIRTAATRSSESLQYLLEIGCTLDKSEAADLALMLSQSYRATSYRLLLQAGQIEFDPLHLHDLTRENAIVPLAGYLKRQKLVKDWKALRAMPSEYWPWIAYWLKYCNAD